MATLISKGPRVRRKPNNLLKQLQSRTNFNVAQVLLSNSLILDGPEARDWTALLQAYWQILAKDFLDGSSYIPTENPGGASDRVQLPEDSGSGGEVRPSFPPDGGGGTTGGDAPVAMPEEPAGRGGRLFTLPVERPGTEDEVDDTVIYSQQPIEDDRYPAQMALVPSFGGDGYHCPESPGAGGGDRVPTGLASSGQDDDSEELTRLQREFEAVPSYVERFADGREVWQ